MKSHGWLFLGLLAASLVAAVYSGFLGWRLNNYAYDLFLYHRTINSIVAPIVIVAIDDAATHVHPALPRDRALVAQALNTICAGGPVAVGIDLIFSDPAPAAGDEMLGDAIKSCKHVVLGNGLVPVKGEAKWFELVPSLAGAAAAIGHVHAQPDADGEVRQVLLAKAAGHQRYWALAFECLRQMRPDPRGRPLEDQDGGVTWGEMHIPRVLLVNFDTTIQTISFEDVLAGRTQRADFAGKAILIGLTTSDDVDRKFTPVSLSGLAMPGVEIHAHLLDTLLRSAFLIPWRESSVLLAQLTLVALAGVVIYYLRGVFLGVALVALAAMTHLAPYFLLLHGSVAPAFSLAAAFWIPVILGGGFQYWTTWRHYLTADATGRRLRQQMEFVTHEMRSPLTAIQGSSELLGRYALDETRRKQMADLIHRESQRLSKMVERFLDVERLSAGEIELRRDPVDLRTVTETVVERARLFAERKEIKLETAIHDAGSTSGDAELLEFAVYNLVSNAVKYSPEGSVVQITARSEGRQAFVEVRDQGAGISREDAAHIFDRFYRTAEAQRSGKPGLGLGLAIVREIARLHGGEVTLDSRPGEGSAFRLVVPLT